MGFGTGFGMGSSSGGVSDGDKGDITVSGAGTIFTVDPAVVTLAKQANLANATVIGRNTAGTGVPEAVTMAQLQTLLNTQNGFIYSFIKKTADTATITSATPANVTITAGGGGNLELAVTSGHYYKFRLTAVWQSDAAIVGIGFGFTIPAKTIFSALAGTLSAGDGTGAGFHGNCNASGDMVIAANVPTANVDTPFVIEGILIPSANGTLTTQVQNETGTNNVMVRQGTLLELWDYGT